MGFTLGGVNFQQKSCSYLENVITSGLRTYLDPLKVGKKNGPKPIKGYYCTYFWGAGRYSCEAQSCLVCTADL